MHKEQYNLPTQEAPKAPNIDEKKILSIGEEKISSLENGDIKLEIATALEKKDRKKWSIDRVVNAVNDAYKEYLEQKKQNNKLRFNGYFFKRCGCSNKDVKSLVEDEKNKSKTIIGGEGGLKELIEFLAMQKKIDKKIADTFEKREDWAIDRVINTISTAYKEYLEQKEQNDRLRFNKNFFKKLNNEDVKSLGKDDSRIWKNMTGKAMHLQEIIKYLSEEEKIGPEILNDFEKQEKWEIERAANTITYAYKEYLDQKKQNADIIFNKEFFGKLKNQDAKTFRSDIPRELKRITGVENLKELIQYLVVKEKIDMVIADDFEKREQKSWDMERIINAINNAYEEYLEQKRRNVNLIFNVWFFSQKCKDKDAKILGTSYTDAWEKISGEKKNLKNIINILSQEGKIEKEVADTFDISEKLSAKSGRIFQYSIENILKIVGNKNLLVEKNLKGKRPDLRYEKDGRIIIFDSKLQTTTGGIQKDKRNYSKIISENYKNGGDLVFICLNGPKTTKINKEDAKVKIRYYHALDFINRLLDNSRNKFLLELIVGDRSDLNDKQIKKISEISDSLKVLKSLVAQNKSSTRNESIDEALGRSIKIEENIRGLAKNKHITKEDLLNIKYKELLNF